MDLNQAAYGVTQSVIENFSDQKSPDLGLAQFFPPITYPGFEVTYKARRARMLLAKDVLRGTQSNMNTFNNYTQKVFKNPFFSEAFNFTSTDIYKVTFGMGVAPTGPQANGLIDATVEYLEECKNKIRRTTETYRASALQTGTITTVFGDAVDFKRQAASMPVLSVISSDRTWVAANLTGASPTATPLEDLAAGADFLRKQGLSRGNEFNVIMGETAFQNFVLSSRVQTERQIFSQFRLADIGRPELADNGFAFHGRVSANYANFNIFTYVDFYEQDDTTKTDYINPTNVIILPNDFVANTTYAGLPTVMGNSFTGQYIAPMEGEFMIYDLIDPVKKSWEFHIDSAPLPLIKSIDRVYTITTS